MRRVLGRLPRWRTRKAVPAPLRLAFAAGAVDALLTVAVVVAVRRASGAPSVGTGESGDAPPFGRRERAVTLSVKVAEVACDMLADGRTVGRAIAGIRLERDTGQPLDLPTAVIRELSGYGTGLLIAVPTRMLRHGDAARTPGDKRRLAARVWAVAVAIWAARIMIRSADPQKRSLEDRIAGTRLVRSRPRRRG